MRKNFLTKRKEKSTLLCGFCEISVEKKTETILVKFGISITQQNAVGSNPGPSFKVSLLQYQELKV